MKLGNYILDTLSSIYLPEIAWDFSLTGVEVRPSPPRGVRRVVDAIFSYTNRNNGFTEKFFVQADVTEEFPFLVTKLSSYYDR